MRTKRISTEEFEHGRWDRVGVVTSRREWEVVERHTDGSVTVVDVPEPAREDWSAGLPPIAPAVAPALSAKHEIRYVRGPLNRRYRCTACPWEGSLPAEHP